jgi:hypothetical protein
LCSDVTGTTVADTILAVYSSTNGCAGPFVQVQPGCDDDSCKTGQLQSRIASQMLFANTTYYIVAWEKGVAPVEAIGGKLQIRIVIQPRVPPPLEPQ